MGWLKRFTTRLGHRRRPVPPELAPAEPPAGAAPHAQPFASSSSANHSAGRWHPPRRHPLRLFEPGYLHRHQTGMLASELTFAALDFETTDLDPRNERVCEVGVVRFCGDGTVLDEYATLVDPERRISDDAYERNEITPELVEGAPVFGSIVDDLLGMLQGSVVVAHNLPFEDSFLRAELRRCDRMTRLPGLCSLVTSRSQLDGPSYKLLSLYKTATGDWPPDGHTALGGARTLAVLIPWLIANCPSPLYYSGPAPVASWQPLPAPSRIAPRAAKLSRRTDGYLGALASRFPATAARHLVEPVALQAYIRRLDQALSDDSITGVEGWELEELARSAGLSQQSLGGLHRDAWDRAGLGAEAARPESVAPGRRKKLIQLAHDLGHPNLASELVRLAADEPAQANHLRQWRIGIDGEDTELQLLRDYVQQNGGAIAKRLTSTVRFVATRDSSCETAQLRKARDLDIPVVSPETAYQELTAAVRAGEAEQERRRQEHESWQRERAQHDAANDAYFRHRWRSKEQSPIWD